MMCIVDNAQVYGLDESIKASKYPMSVSHESCTPIITPMVQKLAACPTGTGHDQFLTGIIVQFDHRDLHSFPTRRSSDLAVQ